MKPSLAFPKSKKRKKPNPRRALIHKLDVALSQVVRARDGYRCCTCGKVDRSPQMHAGHYVSRRCLKLRWDEKNVHAQCAGCNTFKAGNGAAYAAFILRTYGAQELERLDADSRLTWKPTLEELRTLLAHFQSKLSTGEETANKAPGVHGDAFSLPGQPAGQTDRTTGVSVDSGGSR